MVNFDTGWSPVSRRLYASHFGAAGSATQTQLLSAMPPIQPNVDFTILNYTAVALSQSPVWTGIEFDVCFCRFCFSFNSVQAQTTSKMKTYTPRSDDVLITATKKAMQSNETVEITSGTRLLMQSVAVHPVRMRRIANKEYHSNFLQDFDGRIWSATTAIDLGHKRFALIMHVIDTNGTRTAIGQFNYQSYQPRFCSVVNGEYAGAVK